jgi:hypothetical protein
VAEEGERARKLEVVVQGAEGREDEETGAFEVLAVSTFFDGFWVRGGGRVDES